MNGNEHPIQIAFSRYMGRYYDGLFADTKALQSFVARGIERSIVWAPTRMVDAVESMLDSYQRNDNDPTPNQGALFPIMFAAMARDYVPTNGDWGRQTPGRVMIQLGDEPDAPIYGYRQAMMDIRTQVAICTDEPASARSLAAQLVLYCSDFANRRFRAYYRFGHYTDLEYTVMIESPDLVFQKIDSDRKNITILAADITLKATMPYFDAPKEGEENDGSTGPAGYLPGYPMVTGVNVLNRTQLTEQFVE